MSINGEQLQPVSYRPFTAIQQEWQGAHPGEDPYGKGLNLIWQRQNRGILRNLYEKAIKSSPAVELPPIQEPEYLALSVEELKRLTGTFPEAARKRSILAEILCSPEPFYVARDATGKLSHTENREEAIADTAIITGYVNYDKWPKATMVLSGYPEDVIEPAIAPTVLAETYIHEYYHTLTRGLLNPVEGKWTYLRLPDGNVIKGDSFLLDVFRPITEGFSPSTHYASFSRDSTGKFKNADDQVLRKAVSDEFGETGVIMHLGFAGGMTNDPTGDPLADRPMMRPLFDDFLHATELSQAEAEGIQSSWITPEALIKKYNAPAQPNATQAA